MKTNRKLAKVKKNAEVAAELAELRARVSSCMRIGKFNFTGPQPKLRWVQPMRSELRVAVCMLAAASAADPEVELLS